MTWKPIPEYEGYYEASSAGEIRSVDRVVVRHPDTLVHYRGKLLAPGTDRFGYKVVTLSARGATLSFSVHTLVARTFLGERPEGFDVTHKNGNVTDNRAANLKYRSRSDTVKASWSNTGKRRVTSE